MNSREAEGAHGDPYFGILGQRQMFHPEAHLVEVSDETVSSCFHAPVSAVTYPIAAGPGNI
jgi:hypothetical protein